MPQGGLFAGRVAFITGAASGLGRATAAGLARDGARLLLFDLLRLVRLSLSKDITTILWSASKSIRMVK